RRGCDDDVGASDCVTISQATLSWLGACGEQLDVQFSYPVTQGATGREVTGSFDADARFTFRAPGLDAQTQGAIRVDVVTWTEDAADGTHDIDITVTFVDDAFSLGPVRIHGTFCDWPLTLCGA